MRKTIPYGQANYEEIVENNNYFVDKTHYIATLESVNNPIFLRPRKFGKSLWCRILELYYGVKYADDFERLFGHTYIGQHPTPKRNAYLILHLDFSKIKPGQTLAKIEESFDSVCNKALKITFQQAQPHSIKLDESVNATSNLDTLLTDIELQDIPPIYVIIDEYDNFANQLITQSKTGLYYELTDDDSFFKTFFKTLKSGRKMGSIANIFITGVLPLVVDDLASGYNIGTFLTLRPDFEDMLGFTQAEVTQLLDEVYQDYGFDPTTRRHVEEVIKNHYDGYYFVRSPQHQASKALYNSTILMYFLDYFCRTGELPEHLTDQNLKTDLSWAKRLTVANPTLTEEFVNDITVQNSVVYDRRYLVEKFNMAQFHDESYFPTAFFYLGMLTQADHFHLSLPNLNMRQIFVEYFNQIHQISVSKNHTEYMSAFLDTLSLEDLFAGYWHNYIAQFPEAIFNKVNENFYRSTFYELCSRHLSAWFTWNMERSYPSGKSDLEFVGKFNERYAGLRWVIEFKYYSNTKVKDSKIKIDTFKLKKADTRQLAGYVQGLKQEYPEAIISQYVIYCFGNQGFRVFPVS
ncbi:MAG: AAA family ATPase [Chloroflexota bacterium]